MIVELQALATLGSPEAAQLLNSLKATQRPVGILINFGAPQKLQWKRLAATKTATIDKKARIS
jgi:GxxExxY protein